MGLLFYIVFSKNRAYLAEWVDNLHKPVRPNKQKQKNAVMS